MPEPEGLTAALIRLQSQLPRITKTADAQYGKYADLSLIHDAVMPLLGECGLAWTCKPTMVGDGAAFVLAYSLRHAASGEHDDGEYPLPPPNSAPHALGSAITYAKRYAICAVLGIAPAKDDDDAQAAQAAHTADPQPQWRPPANPRTRKAQRSRGPQGDDEWNTADADEPGSMTDAQRARLHATFNRAKILDRADRLAYAMSRLDLPELASSNDLSMRQAGELIARLESEATDG